MLKTKSLLDVSVIPAGQYHGYIGVTMCKVEMHTLKQQATFAKI
jgi:hypothetical protein